MPILEEHLLLVNPDEHLIITSEKKKPKTALPPFIMYGDPRMIRGQQHGYPLTDTLLEMNGHERWFFKLLKDNLDYRTNQAVIRGHTLSRSDQNRLSRAYKSLHEKQLVKRIKREHYLVNPDAIIYPDSYSQVKALWDTL